MVNGNCHRTESHSKDIPRGPKLVREMPRITQAGMPPPLERAPKGRLVASGMPGIPEQLRRDRLGSSERILK